MHITIDKQKQLRLAVNFRFTLLYEKINNIYIYFNYKACMHIQLSIQQMQNRDPKTVQPPKTDASNARAFSPSIYPSFDQTNTQQNIENIPNNPSSSNPTSIRLINNPSISNNNQFNSYPHNDINGHGQNVPYFRSGQAQNPYDNVNASLPPNYGNVNGHPYHYADNWELNPGLLLADKIKNMAMTVIIENLFFITWQMFSLQDGISFFMAVNIIQLAIFAIAWRAMVKDQATTLDMYRKYRKLIIWDLIVMAVAVFVICIIVSNSRPHKRRDDYYDQYQFFNAIVIGYLIIVTLLYMTPKMILLCIYGDRPGIQTQIWVPLGPMRYQPPQPYLQPNQPNTAYYNQPAQPQQLQMGHISTQQRK